MTSRIFFISLIILLIQHQIAFSQDSISVKWHHNLDEAKSEAVIKQLPLLIVFAGSDWCRPCIQLNNQIFKKEEFLLWASSNVVLVHFDFPRQKQNALSKEQQAYNDSMAEIYNPKGAFPKVIIADSNGKEIGSPGFLNVDVPEYIRKLEEIIHILKQ